jgi:hypothetical protein
VNPRSFVYPLPAVQSKVIREHRVCIPGGANEMGPFAGCLLWSANLVILDRSVSPARCKTFGKKTSSQFRRFRFTCTSVRASSHLFPDTCCANARAALSVFTFEPAGLVGKRAHDPGTIVLTFPE